MEECLTMTDPVLFEEIVSSDGKVIAIATLNVEKTLNSLSLEMIDMITPQLRTWQDDEEIAVIVFLGAGDRAFCAGGDIQDLYESMEEHPGGPNPFAEAFFEREYLLDYIIHSSSTPIMVWGHGVVMGGGLGIFGGCSHRVCTERSRIALPEITIGLFPDAGASKFLTQMPLHLAYFMALTGCQINGNDAKLVGLADHLISNDRKESVIDTLAEVAWVDDADENFNLLTRCLNSFDSTTEFPAGQLEAHVDAIRALVSGCAEETFLADFDAALDSIAADDWLSRAIKTFRSGCPATAQIVLEQMNRASQMNLAEMFEMELTIAVQCTRHPDFAEGIRALLIDKDNNPTWKYPELGKVPDSWVAEHFEEPGDLDNPFRQLVDLN
jgi:enoyl-CoA hydratase/carnithine racemase